MLGHSLPCQNVPFINQFAVTTAPFYGAAVTANSSCRFGLGKLPKSPEGPKRYSGVMNHKLRYGVAAASATEDADTKTCKKLSLKNFLSKISTRLLGLTVALTAPFLGVAGAQTLGFALSYNRGLEPEVQLRDLDAGRVGLGLRVAGGSAGPLEAGVDAHFRSSFGPLGTLAINGRADADVTGAFDLGLSGSGALGATGLDAQLDVFNGNSGTFAPTAAYALGSRPFFSGGVGAYLELGATRRLGRTLILEAAPSLSYLAGTGVGVGLWSRLQLRRFVDNDSGALLLLASTGPGAGRSFAAAGAEYGLNRRGLPALTGALLLGNSGEGVRLGLRAAATGERNRFSYRAELSAEPYRRDAPPYRGNVALGTALGPGVLGLEFGAAPDNRFGVPPLLLRSSYAFRF